MSISSGKMLSLIAAILIGSFCWYQPWQQAIIGGADSWGYYAYLPAVFIHQDLETMNVSEEARKKYFQNGRQSLGQLKNGKYLNQYTCGVSILNLPAFGMAHFFAKVTNYSADGYDLPYRFMIVWSGLLYAIGGLFFLRKFLLYHFRDEVIAVTIFAVGIGTNLYFTAVFQGAMAHGYLFFLVALLLYLTQRWEISGNRKLIFSISFLVGLISLIRPNDIIVILIPFFFANRSFSFFKKEPLYLLLAAIVFLLPAVPQLFYWKIITGNWASYSYGEQGFDFINPHLWDGMLGYKNGWLVYTPIMVFAIFGFLIGFFQKKRISIFGFLIIVIHLYIIYSWWCWNYINGFGARPMVDIYPILAFSLALFFSFCSKNKMLNWGVSTLVLFFSVLNIFQTHQHTNKVLWSEEATSAYYWAVFGKTKLNHNALVALDTDILQPRDLSFKKEIGFEGFENLDSVEVDNTLFFSGKKSYCIRPGKEFSPGIKIKWDNQIMEKEDWLKVSAVCLSKGFGSFHFNSHLVISISRKNEFLLWKSIRINNKIRDEYYSVHNGEIDRWKTIDFFIPNENLNIQPGDEISVYGWNTTDIPVFIDDMKVEIWGND
jgi:hypothetical protein